MDKTSTHKYADACYQYRIQFHPSSNRAPTSLLRLSVLHNILPYRHPRTLKHLLQLALCTQRVQVIASAESLPIQDDIGERRMLSETRKDEL
jgi:hypothetical protein